MLFGTSKVTRAGSQTEGRPCPYIDLIPNREGQVQGAPPALLS